MGWNRFIETMPTEFDIYFAGISGGEIISSNEPISEAADVVGATGMFLYAIHHRFYDVFLSADENKNIDCWLSKTGIGEIEKKLGRKPVYKVCYPMAAITNDGISYNSGKEVNHEKNFKAYRVLES